MLNDEIEKKKSIRKKKLKSIKLTNQTCGLSYKIEITA